MIRWLHQVLIALDQLINAIHGGWADETISSRAWRNRHRWPYRFYRWAIDLVFFWQGTHCEQAFESERLRLQAPPEVRS